MKKKILSVCSVFLLLVLTVTWAILPASAEEAAKTEAYVWTFDESCTVVTNGEKTYERYDLPVGYFWEPLESEYYYDTGSLHAVTGKGEKCYAYFSASERGANIMHAELKDGEEALFVTKQGKEKLESFLEGASGVYRLCFYDDYTYASLARREQVEFFQNLEGNETVEVSSLRNLKQYEMRVYDSSNSVFTTIGAFYCFGEEQWGYVDYTKLSNQYFDAYGVFSYRSGSVSVAMLDEEAYGNFLVLSIGAKETTPKWNYESTEVFLEGTNAATIALPLFWLEFALVGFIAPSGVIVISLLMARSRKRGYPKRWYALMTLGAIWALSALALMLMLLF